jgi:hypothetical protein
VTVHVVDYVVARDGPPRRSGLAYDYVLAGDGLFVAAASHLLDVRVAVASCHIRGLPPLVPACTLMRGRLPIDIWNGILECMRAAHELGCEVLLGVAYESGGYRIVIPRQVVGAVSVQYAPHDDLMLEIHSHRDGPAQFSSIDNSDERRLRLYGVVGHLDQVRPEVALRVGAYGYFLPVPWTSVFDGDHPAALNDVYGTSPQCDQSRCPSVPELVEWDT